MNTNKLLLGIVILGVAGMIGYSILRPAPAPQAGSVISRGDAYMTATNTSVNCPTTASTLVLAAASSSESRLYFAATNDSANTVYLCKSSSCTASTGLRLNASGGAKEQAIDDLYYGPWSCIASTTTSTLTVMYKQ